MHHSSFIALALFAPYVIAIPLNINLGAYSPALVVGDGEISFGGKQDVSNLMNALEGAAVAGGAASGAAAAPAAAAIAAAPAQGATTIQASPNDGTQITAVQGMGKEIAPRIVKLIKDSAKTKRDIAGFNAALNFATAALKTSPEIQLGTGEGGSGVGITQKAGGTTSATPKKIVSRDEILSPKIKTTVTTMFVRGGAVPAVVRSEGYPASIEKRSVEERTPAPVSPAPDGVNLNMAEGQVAELTFVETREVDESEE